MSLRRVHLLVFQIRSFPSAAGGSLPLSVCSSRQRAVLWGWKPEPAPIYVLIESRTFSISVVEEAAGVGPMRI